jgi:hypothetical protein
MQKNFADIELAKEHSKSFCHEVTEGIQGRSREIEN